jgi:hypothetical protein
MHRRRQILGPVAILWAASSCSVLGAEPPSPWRVTQATVVDSDVWRWNWASWDQDKIATVGDFQYTVFWDADGVFVLARRDLRDQRVQTLRRPDFKLSSDDPHRNTCLGVSPQDGRLHLSWDHHNNPLRYARSRAGFLTNPPPQLSVEDIERWRSYPLAGPEIAGLDASKHDRRRWQTDGILSITAKAGERGFAIVDLKLQAPP